MADPSGSFPAQSLIGAISASLRLVNESVDSLTASQLLAIQRKLHETLRIIDGKVQLQPVSGHQKVVIDNSDDEDSDTDNADNKRMETGGETDGPLPIPGPYVMAPPAGQEAADAYYVVDRGREVGIFSDNVSSTRAISGIPHGHQVRVKTWYDAAKLYNSLWDKGFIERAQS